MTNTTQHTLGPLKIGPRDDNGDITIITNNGFIVGRINRFSESFGDKKDSVNAARIVACVNACEGINPDAVPEMLEALKGISKAFQRIIEQYEPDSNANEWIAHAHDAISKAGGAP